MGKVIVHVEYCGAWGYGSKYERLKRAILEAVPEAEVTGTVGRKTSFEVKINGELFYSKLKTGSMPKDNDTAQIVDMVQKAASA